MSEVTSSPSVSLVTEKPVTHQSVEPDGSTSPGAEERHLNTSQHFLQHIENLSADERPSNKDQLREEYLEWREKAPEERRGPPGGIMFDLKLKGHVTYSPQGIQYDFSESPEGAASSGGSSYSRNNSHYNSVTKYRRSEVVHELRAVVPSSEDGEVQRLSVADAVKHVEEKLGDTFEELTGKNIEDFLAASQEFSIQDGYVMFSPVVVDSILKQLVKILVRRGGRGDLAAIAQDFKAEVGRAFKAVSGNTPPKLFIKQHGLKLFELSTAETGGVLVRLRNSSEYPDYKRPGSPSLGKHKSHFTRLPEVGMRSRATDTLRHILKVGDMTIKQANAEFERVTGEPFRKMADESLRVFVSRSPVFTMQRKRVPTKDQFVDVVTETSGPPARDILLMLIREIMGPFPAHEPLDRLEENFERMHGVTFQACAGMEVLEWMEDAPEFVVEDGSVGFARGSMSRSEVVRHVGNALRAHQGMLPLPVLRNEFERHTGTPFLAAWPMGPRDFVTTSREFGWHTGHVRAGPKKVITTVMMVTVGPDHDPPLVLHGTLSHGSNNKWYMRADTQNSALVTRQELFFVMANSRHAISPEQFEVGRRVQFLPTTLRPSPNPLATEVQIETPNHRRAMSSSAPMTVPVPARRESVSDEASDDSAGSGGSWAQVASHVPVTADPAVAEARRGSSSSLSRSWADLTDAMDPIQQQQQQQHHQNFQRSAQRPPGFSHPSPPLGTPLIFTWSDNEGQYRRRSGSSSHPIAPNKGGADHDPELEGLLNLLPSDLADAIHATDFPETPHRIEEVVLHVGRLPAVCWADGAEDDIESYGRITDIDPFLQALRDEGVSMDFPPGSNVMQLGNTMHTVCRTINRKRECVGLLLRVGRRGPSLVPDLVSQLSVSGGGVTMRVSGMYIPFLRELSQQVAEKARKRCVVIDTWSDIGGPHDIPYEAIGRAYRLQVPGLPVTAKRDADAEASANVTAQSDTIRDGLRNHRAGVIIVDELLSVHDVKMVKEALQNQCSVVVGTSPARSSIVDGIKFDLTVEVVDADRIRIMRHSGPVETRWCEADGQRMALFEM